MPNKLIDITGQRFGSLVVRERYSENTKDGKPRWICDCDCGNVTITPGRSLRCGQAKSCGLCKRTLTPLHVRTHRNRLYHTWSEMKRRCNGHCTNSDYYKGKNISYCKEWENFDDFADWAEASGYIHGLEIDRIDGEKNYSPDNCRWVSHKMNSRNRKARKNNTTGIAGVYIREKANGKIAYRVSISSDGGKINLGQYDTLEEAAKVRKAAEIKYWGFNIGE